MFSFYSSIFYFTGWRDAAFLPSKRKFLIPYLVAFMLWPIMAIFWALSFGDRSSPVIHPREHIVREGFWYTFDNQQTLASFLYYHVAPVFYLPALLAFVDVLILGTFVCIPIFFITLIRRRRIK